jgi:hypothetical protein
MMATTMLGVYLALINKLIFQKKIKTYYKKDFIMKKIQVLISTLFLLNSVFAQSVTLTPGKVESDGDVAYVAKITSTSTPTITSTRQGGTAASPSNTADGQGLVSIEGAGWVSGSATGAQARLKFTATQNWNSTKHGNKFEIFTTANNSDTPFARLLVSNKGKIGIGNYFLLEPDHQLEVQQTSTSDKGIGVYRYGGDAPSFFGIGARGIGLLPAATDSLDLLLRIGGKGHDGTAYTDARARIDMQAINNWTSTSTGTDMKFYTTKTDETEPSLKMILKDNGNLGLGTTEPKATTGINGDLRFASTHTFHLNGDIITLPTNGKSVVRVVCNNGNFKFSCLPEGKHGQIQYVYFTGPDNCTIKEGNWGCIWFKSDGNTGLTINGAGGVIFIYLLHFPNDPLSGGSWHLVSYYD